MASLLGHADRDGALAAEKARRQALRDQRAARRQAATEGVLDEGEVAQMAALRAQFGRLLRAVESNRRTSLRLGTAALLVSESLADLPSLRPLAASWRDGSWEDLEASLRQGTPVDGIAAVRALLAAGVAEA